jgi:hypothetical protein
MNKITFSMSLLYALVVAFPSFTQPAEAQDNTGIRNGDLPQVHFWKARKRIRVERTGPIVTYDEPEEKEPIYLIPTGLPRAKAPKVILMPGPGDGGGNGNGSVAGGGINVPPGYTAIDPNKLPKSKFDSNIPAGGLNQARNLGDGRSTNRLSSKMWAPPKSPAGMIATPLPARTVSPSAPKTAVYSSPATGGSATGSSSSKTSLDVHAVVTKKFDLLKK